MGEDRKTVAGASELIERKSNSIARLQAQAKTEGRFDRADVARQSFGGADLVEMPGGCGGIDQELSSWRERERRGIRRGGGG